eukprot:11164675-Lingulodinium_polyedra.AAC.1
MCGLSYEFPGWSGLRFVILLLANRVTVVDWAWPGGRGVVNVSPSVARPVSDRFWAGFVCGIGRRRVSTPLPLS